jgi:hypothetical protein
MNRIVLKSRVSKDGLLQLAVPANVAGADEEVQVTIESVVERPEMSPEEWRLHVLSRVGTWEGDFERPPQDWNVERDSMS